MFYISRKDNESLSDALMKLKSKELRQQLGTIGAEKIRKNFNWNTIIEARLNDAMTSIKECYEK